MSFADYQNKAVNVATTYITEHFDSREEFDNTYPDIWDSPEQFCEDVLETVNGRFHLEPQGDVSLDEYVDFKASTLCDEDFVSLYLEMNDVDDIMNLLVNSERHGIEGVDGIASGYALEYIDIDSVLDSVFQ